MPGRCQPLSAYLIKRSARRRIVRRSTAAVHARGLVKGKIFMKLQFRQRLLSSTLLIGVAALATPAFAQDTSPPTPPPPTPPTDAMPTNVQANPSGPVEGQPVPARTAQGAPVASGQAIIGTGTR